MSLLFGNLIQAFVIFGESVALAKVGDATAEAALPGVVADFRRIAAEDASYLVCIGR